MRGEVDRLMLLCPPQHGKSTVSSKRFPAYVLGKDPTKEVISASATASLAEGFGREVRNCISSAEYEHLFPETRLAEDSQAKGLWSTNEGGGYYAVGIGGALMGRGGEIGIIDDPFATWEDAQSENSREKVWDWYNGTFYNRMRPGAAIIVIQHRMHEDDLVGRLLEAEKNGGDKWEVVKLPALLDNPPWAERYNRAALERLKANTPIHKWAALYDQDPTPPDGSFFRKEWFRRYRRGEEPKLHYYASSDHAPAGTEDSDYNCFRMWGIDKAGDLYLVDGFRTQETMDKSAEKMIGSRKQQKQGLLEKYRPFAWFPEDDNNWKAIQGFVTKLMREERVACRIEPISPHGSDKAAKAQAFQAMASMGRVWVPYGPEGDEIIAQYLKFPGGKHDDEVDAAGTIGRAIQMAHPAVVSVKEPPKQRDRWAPANFEDDEDFNWKVA